MNGVQKITCSLQLYIHAVKAQVQINVVYLDNVVFARGLKYTSNTTECTKHWVTTVFIKLF